MGAGVGVVVVVGGRLAHKEHTNDGAIRPTRHLGMS